LRAGKEVQLKKAGALVKAVPGPECELQEVRIDEVPEPYLELCQARINQQQGIDQLEIPGRDKLQSLQGAPGEGFKDDLANGFRIAELEGQVGPALVIDPVPRQGLFTRVNAQDRVAEYPGNVLCFCRPCQDQAQKNVCVAGLHGSSF